MGRCVYVYRDGKLVQKHLAPPRHRSDPAPHVISDVMDALKHMGTGETIDSKSRFRAATRASGCEEVGNDPAILRDRPKVEPRGVEMDVKRALEELRSR